jgi:predicted nucleic acid-binding protein
MVKPTVVLDSEALAAAARGHRGMRVTLAAAKANGQLVLVPTVVLAEVLTGAAADAAVWHVVGRIGTRDLTTAIAARAAALRNLADKTRRKRRDMTVDAIVMATAEAVAPAALVTGDPGDMSLLLGDVDVRVTGLG